MGMRTLGLVAVGFTVSCGAPLDDLGEGAGEELDTVKQAVFVTVPARIQAESYERAFETTPTVNSGGQCNRNDGVDMELTSDNAGGCNVGWSAATEWLEYDITTATAQTFSVIARVASANTGQTFHINLDGVNLGSLASPSSGWQTFQDRSYSNVNIGAGNHTLRFVFDTGNVNLNYIELTSGAPPPPPPPTGTIQAESYSSQSGTQLENGNTTVGFFDAGDFLAYSNVNLSGVRNLRIRMAKGAGAGLLEVRTGSKTGPLLANYAPTSTGSWTTWQERDVPITPTSGTHTLFLVAAGTTGVMNLDWLRPNDGATLLTYKNPGASVSSRVADLVGRMTLAEKIGQMTQGESDTTTAANVTSLFIGSILSGGFTEPEPNTPAAWADLSDNLQRAAMATRLGIPLLYGIDAVHGHSKVLGATVFPHNIGLGATRNSALVQSIGQITAKEMYATGMPWAFAPTLAVARDQRWGRTYESFGETPELATMMTSQIAGLQGAGLGTANAVLATAKHFVADGGALWGTGSNPGGTGIDRGDAQMNEQALRAIHLRAYYDAISRGAGSIMPSYSSYNGTKMHGNSYLLNTVLKGELGFSGFLISDWEGINTVSSTLATAARTSVNAGVDMFMQPNNFSTFISTLTSEVNAGRVTTARINDAVSRILTKKFQLGLFERPFANRTEIGTIGSAAHRDVARQAVRESLVLLKNTGNILPLARNTSVCVSGNGASNLRAQAGGWTLGWDVPEGTIVGETIRTGLTALGVNVVTSGCTADIRVVSEISQSYVEWLGDDADPDHDNSGSCVTSNCVVVIVGGRPLDIQGFDADPKVKAIVMAWYPGSEGRGVGEVLFRNASGGINFNFTGKLPMTWKVDATDTPVNYCPSTGTDANGNGTPDVCEDAGAHYSNLSSPPSSVFRAYDYGLRYP